MAGRVKKTSADEFLKEQERISLAEELMDLGKSGQIAFFFSIRHVKTF